MDYNFSDLMPFDTEKYLSMLFVSSGFIMLCFYFMDLSERKEWIALFLLAAGVAAVWHFAVVHDRRVPGFWS